jgi:tRNA threonylcarbamoyladenosine biosynthesis protein TsaE
MLGKAVGEEYRSVSLPDLPMIAEQCLERAVETKVWLFRGEMGAGKTTFIKAICNALGVLDAMSSPTFSIVNEYATQQAGRIFHFDFFRIKNEAEAYDIGTEEYFYSGNFCFVEWPEKIPSLIPLQFAEIEITLENDTLRTIALSVHDGKEKNRI